MVVVSNEWLVDAAEKLALLRENGVIMSAQPPAVPAAQPPPQPQLQIHNTSMNSNNNSQMIRPDWSQYQQPTITPQTPPPPPPPQQQQLNQKKLLDSQQEQILTINNLHIQQQQQQQNNNNNTISNQQQQQQQQIQILTPQNNKIVSKTAARAVLLCQDCSYFFETRTILLEPEQEVRVGRAMSHGRPNNTNAAFECKVLSRNHAVIMYSDGKFYIKDAGSSNGTFINNNRLSLAGKESRLTEVHSGDVVKFGVNVIENSRKETYGCIIAVIKLYLPDGTEATNVQITNVRESDLYRLNNYIQDAAQREQVLESKLQSLQKIIEITKKNSLSSWQALIDEDRLLSRIDILENKLFCCQKSLGDDKLREEILKLQEDKWLYQNSAKEALHKVYQERMEALQKLATIERAFCSSEDECSLIRDQLIQSQQHVQDVTIRLADIEEKYEKLNEQYSNNSLAKEVQQLKQQLHLCKDNMAHANEQLSSYYSGDVRMKWFDNSELKNIKGSEAIINAICNDNDTNDDDNVQLNNTKIYDKLLAIEKYLNVLEEACKDKVMLLDHNNALTDNSAMITSSTTSSINSSIITTIGKENNNKTIEDCKMEEKIDEKEDQHQHQHQNDNNNNNTDDNNKNNTSDGNNDNKNITDNENNKIKTDDNNGNIVHHHINGNMVDIHQNDHDDNNNNNNNNDNTNYTNINIHQNLVNNSILQLKNVINELVQYFSPENNHWNEEYQSAKEKYSVLESKLMSTALELQTLQMELQTRPTYNQYKEKIKLCEDLQDDLKATKINTKQLQEQIDELKLIKSQLENNLSLLSGTNNTINNNNNNNNDNDNNKNDNNNENHSNENGSIENNGNAINNVDDKNIVNNVMDKNCINSNNNNINNISNKQQINEASLNNDKQKNHFDLMDTSIEKDDLKMLNDPDVQREEELIAFKEKCAHLIDENLLLKKQINDLKSNTNHNNNNNNKNTSLLQKQSYTTLLMYLAPFIAIIGYFLISPYF